MEERRDAPSGADEFDISRREALRFAVLFVVQTVLMIGVFVGFGYDRKDDPLGFPLGMPTWFVFGVLLPAMAFLAVTVVMALRMREVSLK